MADGMLLRGVARTAIRAGTATAVSNRVSRRQAQRWAEQGQPVGTYMQAPQEAPPPQQGAGSEDTIAQLKELGELRERRADRGGVRGAEGEAAQLLAGGFQSSRVVWPRSLWSKPSRSPCGFLRSPWW